MNYLKAGNEGVRIVLFDLGGVLVRWDGIEGLKRLAGFSEEETYRFWLHSEAVQKFESGRCNPEEFSREVVVELGLKIGADEWLRRFISWDRGPFPGAGDLLVELGSRYELGCLSNNNELHWSRVRDLNGFGQLFGHHYLSHEIGLRKPNPRMFQYVMADLGVPPGGVFYMDDSAECIEAAQELGIRAVQVRGLDDVRAALLREELL